MAHYRAMGSSELSYTRGMPACMCTAQLVHAYRAQLAWVVGWRTHTCVCSSTLQLSSVHWPAACTSWAAACDTTVLVQPSSPPHQLGRQATMVGDHCFNLCQYSAYTRSPWLLITQLATIQSYNHARKKDKWSLKLQPRQSPLSHVIAILVLGN